MLLKFTETANSGSNMRHCLTMEGEVDFPLSPKSLGGCRYHNYGCNMKRYIELCLRDQNKKVLALNNYF